MLKWRIWLAVSLLCSSFWACGDDDEGGEEEFDMSGLWVGSMVASDAAVSGNLTIDVVQDGEDINGTATVSNLPCFSTVRFRGTLNMETFQFQAELYDDTDPNKLVTMNGTVFVDSNSLEASYFADNWGVCTNGFGDLQATRVEQ